MEKKMISFFILIVLFSCSEESLKTADTADQARNSFKSFQDFLDTKILVGKLSSKDEMLAYSRGRNYDSWLEHDDTSSYSFSFKSLLNANREVIIANEIVWFNDNVFYSIPKSEEANLVEFKKNPKVEFKVGTYEINTVISARANANAGAKVDLTSLGFTSLDASNQYVFTQQTYDPCTGTVHNANGGKKFIHEIHSTLIKFANGLYEASLYLRLKLEYRNGGSWSAAGELRDMTVNLTGGSWRVYPATTTNPMSSYSVTYNCSQDQDIPLIDFTTFTPTGEYWIVELDGTISHQIHGDTSANIWVNDGPLHDNVLW